MASSRVARPILNARPARRIAATLRSHYKPSMALIDLANPTRFLALTARLLPWLAIATALAFVAGLYLAWFVAPDDYQQGATVKIMFVHVPNAWLAMAVWTVMSIA